VNDIEIILKLSYFCIETAARKEFKRLLDLMFSTNEAGDESVLAEKIELLRNFLLKYNFNDLRASDARLSGSIESVVIIFRDINGEPVFKIAL
jgi:hypothetical protein